MNNIDYVKKTMEMEGFIFTEKELEILQKISNGDLPAKALIDYNNECIEKLKILYPDKFAKGDE